MVLKTLEAELHVCTHYFSVFAARTHLLHLQSEKIWSLLFLKHTQLCNCRCRHPQAFANLPIPVNQSSLKSLSLPGVRRILLQVDFTSVLTTVYPHNLEPFKNLSRPRLLSSLWPPFRLPLFFPPFLSLHTPACNPFFMLSLYCCSPFYSAPPYLRCPVSFFFRSLFLLLLLCVRQHAEPRQLAGTPCTRREPLLSGTDASNHRYQRPTCFSEPFKLPSIPVIHSACLYTQQLENNQTKVRTQTLSDELAILAPFLASHIKLDSLAAAQSLSLSGMFFSWSLRPCLP